MENSEFYKRIDDLKGRAERRGVLTRTAFLTPAEQYALQQYYHGDGLLLTGGQPDCERQAAFFLPDFNDTEAIVRDVLFMIDTSGSMSRDMITRAYSEVKGAIDQFNGKLTGKLGFFDAAVVPPIPFEDEEEFKVIQPKGGGGTSFEVIFDYVNKQMSDDPPVSIIILTDGFAPFPDEEKSDGIPVLWMINNEQVTPPWGKTARIKEEKQNE